MKLLIEASGDSRVQRHLKDRAPLSGCPDGISHRHAQTSLPWPLEFMAGL